MKIVVIASDWDASSVFAKLQALGAAWRPAEDVPWLVYVEAGSAEEIERIPGVRACWEGRSGRIARLLHDLPEGTARAAPAAPPPRPLGGRAGFPGRA